eukprot:CAMPEP_0181210718 /NCGR_PEP_ID=MMETSP1096-20121128/23390_1 /TAXON_ID=156174 ORGANISM="Chrysochromulina ericina, Strain CCMP281" /NCGR_SAMPLE_ID=MMETSP1096 /ASSEMBLY_ACC=CAM_ASM_000453 /LENGTH=167 /DNA_ID=CAMNT_0023302047 /DNA_START=155 /DNA_END=658 /DNA_ORIENTATION=+
MQKRMQPLLERTPPSSLAPLHQRIPYLSTAADTLQKDPTIAGSYFHGIAGSYFHGIPFRHPLHAPTLRTSRDARAIEGGRVSEARGDGAAAGGGVGHRRFAGRVVVMLRVVSGAFERAGWVGVRRPEENAAGGVGCGGVRGLVGRLPTARRAAGTARAAAGAVIVAD